MRCRWIALLSILVFASAVERAGEASGWKPVTNEELKMTAADIGDADADAAVLFRQGELNDSSPDGTSLKVYIRIKIFNDRGRRYASLKIVNILPAVALTITPPNQICKPGGCETGRRAKKALM